MFRSADCCNGIAQENSSSNPDFLEDQDSCSDYWCRSDLAPGEELGPHSDVMIRRSDPFLPENRIPLPTFAAAPGAGHPGERDAETPEPPHGRRRNERERQRVRSVNEGFERLRRYVPPHSDNAAAEGGKGRRHTSVRRRYSKVDVLRSAIGYIRHLQALLRDSEQN